MTTAVSEITNNKTNCSAGVTGIDDQLRSAQGNKSNTDPDIGNLLLEQAQQLRDLEAARKKLESERDTLQRQCKILANKVKHLESDAESTTPVNRCELSPGNGQALSIADLPMIDPSEFLPIVDQPEKETAVKRLFRLVRP